MYGGPAARSPWPMGWHSQGAQVADEQAGAGRHAHKPGVWATKKNPLVQLGTRHMNPSFNSFLYCGGFQRGPDFPPKKEEPKLAMADRKPSDYGTGTQRVRQWAVNSVEAKEKH